jgi:hypothetical protein
MGFDFTAAISGSTAVAVASGQTANFAALVNPLNGSGGNFTFSCAALPANAQCVFNPTSMTVGSGASGNVTVQILTGKSGSAYLESPSLGHLLPLVCGFLLLPFAIRRRRKALLLVALFVVMTGALSSCAGFASGSSSGSSGSSSSTPAGTYAIPVTFTSTGISHAVNVTLTVD